MGDRNTNVVCRASRSSFLSNESRALAPKVVRFDRQASTPAIGDRWRVANAHQARARVGARTVPVSSTTTTSRYTSGIADVDRALPLNEFLEGFHRERRRAERSGAALSLVIYQVGEDNAQNAQHVDRLLAVLHSVKRETDTVGHVGHDRIAVLCPETDEQGTHGLLRKVDTNSSDIPFSAVTATYPNVLFDNLARGTDAQSAFRPFLVGDVLGQDRRSFALKRALDILGAVVALVILR